LKKNNFLTDDCFLFKNSHLSKKGKRKMRKTKICQNTSRFAIKAQKQKKLFLGQTKKLILKVLCISSTCIADL